MWPLSALAMENTLLRWLRSRLDLENDQEVEMNRATRRLAEGSAERCSPLAWVRHLR